MEAILDRTPHPDVNLYILCQQRYNVLPYSGGLANQPARLVEKWSLIEEAIRKLKELDRMSVK